MVYTLKLTLKGKHYSQVKCHIDWDKTIINKKEYSVVRIALIKRDGKPIYKEPMLLISTLKIENYLDAKEIYHIYLHRAKIEGVFKFLKAMFALRVENKIPKCYNS